MCTSERTARINSLTEHMAALAGITRCHFVNCWAQCQAPRAPGPEEESETEGGLACVNTAGTPLIEGGGKMHDPNTHPRIKLDELARFP